jgi:hypothetical protein
VHSNRHSHARGAFDLIDQCLRKDLQEFGLGIMEQSHLSLLLRSEVVEIGHEGVFYEAVLGVGLRPTATDVYFFIFTVHSLYF